MTQETQPTGFLCWFRKPITKLKTTGSTQVLHVVLTITFNRLHFIAHLKESLSANATSSVYEPAENNIQASINPWLILNNKSKKSHDSTCVFVCRHVWVSVSMCVLVVVCVCSSLCSYVISCVFVHPGFRWCVFINLSGLSVLIVLSVSSCVLRCWVYGLCWVCVKCVKY